MAAITVSDMRHRITQARAAILKNFSPSERARCLAFLDALEHSVNLMSSTLAKLECDTQFDDHLAGLQERLTEMVTSLDALPKEPNS
jgi:hypothetical protein